MELRERGMTWSLVTVQTWSLRPGEVPRVTQHARTRPSALPAPAAPGSPPRPPPPTPGYPESVLGGLTPEQVCVSAGWGWGVTSDHTPDGEAHGEADQGHEYPEDCQEVPVLTHAEQLPLQPAQATWGGGSCQSPVPRRAGREGAVWGWGQVGQSWEAGRGLCLT